MPIIYTSRLITGGKDLGEAWIVIDDGRITDVSRIQPAGNQEPDFYLDAGVLAPGFIDAQINGCFGVDFAVADQAEWDYASYELVSTGTTSFVPTYVTAPIKELSAALREQSIFTERYSRNPTGARALPAHLEGPFLAPLRRGAHRAEHLRLPAPQLVDEILNNTHGCLGYVTLAPELPGGLDAVKRFTQAGVRVSVGHSDASDLFTLKAADHGASMITHLYNAQRPLHHRDPGVVGAALSDDRFTSGLIMDNFHVESTALRVAFQAAPGRIMLVTDAMCALGMPPGTYELGGSTVVTQDNQPPRLLDGTIAGASQTLPESVSNTVRAGIDLASALHSVTGVPANSLGQLSLGRVERGATADFTWLSLSGQGPTFTVTPTATWVAGELIWSSRTAPLALQALAHQSAKSLVPDPIGLPGP